MLDIRGDGIYSGEVNLENHTWDVADVYSVCVCVSVVNMVWWWCYALPELNIRIRIYGNGLWQGASPESPPESSTASGQLDWSFLLRLVC